MLTFDIYETISGDKALGPFEMKSSSWAARLETGGQVSAVHPFRDSEERIPRAEWHEMSDPTGSFTLVISDPRGVVAAGVIMTSEVDDDAGTLTLGGQDLADVFWGSRLGSGVGSIQNAGIKFDNRSASGAVRRILDRAMAEGEHPAWFLPVDLPSDGSGSFDVDSKWYELWTAAELLDEVRAEGYRIHHRPYFTSAGTLRYTTQVAKQIVGDEWTFSQGATETALSGLKYRRDGQDMVTGVIHAGNGEGSKMMTRWAGVGTVTDPVRDRPDTSNKSIKNGATLQRIANADIAANGRPQRALSYTVRPDGELELSDFVPGTVIAIDIRDHEIIPPGLWRTTVTALSGDVTGLAATPEVEVVEVLP